MLWYPLTQSTFSMEDPRGRWGELTFCNAAWRGRCGVRRRCREQIGRWRRGRWGRQGWASRTRGRCRSSRWRCWWAGCTARRASPAPQRSQICEKCTLSTLFWWVLLLAAGTRTRRVTWERCRPLGQFCPPGLDQQRIKPGQLWVDLLQTGCYCKTVNLLYFLNNWPVKCPKPKQPLKDQKSFFLVLVHQVLHFIFCDLKGFLPRKHICRSSMLGLFLRV